MAFEERDDQHSHELCSPHAQPMNPRYRLFSDTCLNFIAVIFIYTLNLVPSVP